VPPCTSTAGIERLDVYVDGRPRASTDVTDGASNVSATGVTGAGIVRVEGCAGGELAAARTERT
jgi:hypothetical protein